MKERVFCWSTESGRETRFGEKDTNTGVPRTHSPVVGRPGPWTTVGRVSRLGTGSTRAGRHPKSSVSLGHEFYGMTVFVGPGPLKPITNPN